MRGDGRGIGATPCGDPLGGEVREQDTVAGHELCSRVPVVAAALVQAGRWVNHHGRTQVY